MKLLTPEACAEMLAVSRSTVLRMISDGALPAVCLRRGKRKAVYRIREEILERWVKERETRKHPPTPVITEPKATVNNRPNGGALD